MDAWWPLLVRAEFQPVLGPTLLDQVESDFPINDEPGPGAVTAAPPRARRSTSASTGSSRRTCAPRWASRSRGPLNRVYCGKGALARCRRRAAELAGARPSPRRPQQVYPADGVCQAGDQMCSDSIQFRAIGAITQPLIEWVNRPTFQQADEIQGHGPR